VAKIVFTPPAFGDLERVLDFYAKDPDRVRAHIDVIRDAISIPARHSVIGHLVDADVELRELVISRGRHRFLALYRYVERPEHVRILRIRHQRELGYPAR
jgi:plasmid stabilization system protein ParE